MKPAHNMHYDNVGQALLEDHIRIDQVFSLAALPTLIHAPYCGLAQRNSRM